MRYAPITDRLAKMGGAKWEVHHRARRMQAAGTKVIELTIGEPDVMTPPEMIEKAVDSMRSGRVGYSSGRGEPGLLAALAARYTERRGRTFTIDNFICFPGTQTTLYALLNALAGAGDEVLVGDPSYATYEGVILSSGAVPVPVVLRPEHGFRMQVADVEAAITPRTRALFLNTPHNPTGAVLSHSDITALGALAVKHDLWIVSDEVYEDLVFPGATFVSPLDFPELAERVVACTSISKSHAAPGFRSGWCVGPKELCDRIQPFAETMLFGNPPFIADMTAQAISAPSPVAGGMAERFARRAALIRDRLQGQNGLGVHNPEAGMFTLIDVRATGLSGEAFANGLLDQESVAVMPGESFGPALSGWLRVSLTQPDELITQACDRIARHAAQLMPA